MTPEQAVKVNSTSEEYQYIGKQACACGGAFFQQGVRPSYTQSLVFDQADKPFDRIHIQCPKCQQSTDFWFDIESFYGKF